MAFQVASQITLSSSPQKVFCLILSPGLWSLLPLGWDLSNYLILVSQSTRSSLARIFWAVDLILCLTWWIIPAPLLVIIVASLPWMDEPPLFPFPSFLAHFSLPGAPFFASITQGSLFRWSFLAYEAKFISLFTLMSGWSVMHFNSRTYNLHDNRPLKKL